MKLIGIFVLTSLIFAGGYCLGAVMAQQDR